MRNLIGQELEVGQIVFRGGRNGNSSDFKIGRVTKVDNSTNKVTVKWEYVDTNRWYRDSNNVGISIRGVRECSGTGSPNPISLVVVGHSALDYLKKTNRAHKEAISLNIPAADYNEFVDAYLARH